MQTVAKGEKLQKTKGQEKNPGHVARVRANAPVHFDLIDLVPAIVLDGIWHRRKNRHEKQHGPKTEPHVDFQAEASIFRYSLSDAVC